MQAWKVRCVQAYIGVHLHAAISIDNLAEVARSSADGLIEAFKAYFSCTPQDYILRKRVERAMSLMMSSDDPIGQISVECGFENQRQLEQSLHEMVGEYSRASRGSDIRSSRREFAVDMD